MSENYLERLRKICFEYPGTEERLSHGEPTFFAGGKRVFASYTDGRYGNGRFAAWLPAPEGMQSVLVESQPKTYYRPPYVGHRGWIGVVLENISDEDLAFHIQDGWRLVASKKLQSVVERMEISSKPKNTPRFVRYFMVDGGWMVQ